MGLSSKQVSGEGFDWGESLIQTGVIELPKVTPVKQSAPPLKCPRCESMNTKFCYFNNYNQSQPRYFCKACKRHWTKGGTLRDVPVGGGRRNKRPKTNQADAETTSIKKSRFNNYERNENMITKVAAQSQQHQKHPLRLYEENNFNEILNYQSFFQPRSSVLPVSSSSDFKNTLMSSTESMNSVVPLQNLLPSGLISLSYTSSFENPFKLPKDKLSEDLIPSTGTTTYTTMTPMPVQWHTSTPSSAIGPSSYWNFEDFNTLMSADAKEPWDDSFEQH